jgi:hypothetical protein
VNVSDPTATAGGFNVSTTNAKLHLAGTSPILYGSPTRQCVREIPVRRRSS